MARAIMPVLAARYRYDRAAVEPAREQQKAIVVRLRDRLAHQQALGRNMLIGDSLSALDIYWAAMAGAIEPLPEDLCPNMPPDMRAGYSDLELREIGGDALFNHRDRIYREWLKLPMDF